MAESFVRQMALILLKYDVWLNFNKLSSKAKFFKCQTHFLHSSTKRAGIPRILVTGEYFCLLHGNFRL